MDLKSDEVINSYLTCELLYFTSDGSQPGVHFVRLIIKSLIMKLTTTLFLFITASISISQNFEPFKSIHPKRFANTVDASDNDYFFYAIETNVNSDTTTFKQYMRISHTSEVDVSNTICSGWGGDIVPRADTTWLGRRFHYKSSTQELILKNINNESIIFDFGIALGDSAVFYSAIGGDYYIKYTSLNQELILDSLEWTKTFIIKKYDVSENLVPSNLNGFEIKLTENLGLASFIEINNFPMVETSMNLVGQLNPTLGYYQLTYEEVFPWQIGDTLQYYGGNHNYEYDLHIYSTKLVVVQNRVETVDSVWIYFNVDTQIDKYPDISPFPLYAFNINFPNPLVFRKTNNLNPMPNNAYHDFIEHKYDSITYCGNTVAQYQSDGASAFPAMYCDSCDCFSPIDAFGFDAVTQTFVAGYGQIFYDINQINDFYVSRSASLIYSNINGQACGTYYPLGVPEYSYNPDKILVKIVDVLGRECLDEPNKVIIYIYSDGSTEKKFGME